MCKMLFEFGRFNYIHNQGWSHTRWQVVDGHQETHSISQECGRIVNNYNYYRTHGTDKPQKHGWSVATYYINRYIIILLEVTADIHEMQESVKQLSRMNLLGFAALPTDLSLLIETSLRPEVLSAWSLKVTSCSKLLPIRREMVFFWNIYL